MLLAITIEVLTMLLAILKGVLTQLLAIYIVMQLAGVTQV